MAGPATMWSFSIETLCGVMTGSASTTATNIVPLITPSAAGCTVVPERSPVRSSFVYVVLSCETHATNAGAPADVLVVYRPSGPTVFPGASHSRETTKPG